MEFPPNENVIPSICQSWLSMSWINEQRKQSKALEKLLWASFFAWVAFRKGWSKQKMEDEWRDKGRDKETDVNSRTTDWNRSFASCNLSTWVIWIRDPSKSVRRPLSQQLNVLTYNLISRPLLDLSRYNIPSHFSAYVMWASVLWSIVAVAAAWDFRISNSTCWHSTWSL